MIMQAILRPNLEFDEPKNILIRCTKSDKPIKVDNSSKVYLKLFGIPALSVAY